MTAEVTIRSARTADIAAIYRVNQRSLEAAYSAVLPARKLVRDSEIPDEQYAWFRKVIKHDSMAAHAALIDDTVVGFAEFIWAASETRAFVGDSEAELRAIYVRPGLWGEGIGSRLLGRGIQSPPHDCPTVAVGVLADNERARTFYERRGFSRVGTAEITLRGVTLPEITYRRSLR